MAQNLFYENCGANIKYEAIDYEHLMPIDSSLDEWPVESCDSQSDAMTYNAYAYGYCNNGYDAADKVLEHLFTNIPEISIESLQPPDLDW